MLSVQLLCRQNTSLSVAKWYRSRWFKISFNLTKIAHERRPDRKSTQKVEEKSSNEWKWQQQKIEKKTNAIQLKMDRDYRNGFLSLATGVTAKPSCESFVSFESDRWAFFFGFFIWSVDISMNNLFINLEKIHLMLHWEKNGRREKKKKTPNESCSSNWLHMQWNPNICLLNIVQHWKKNRRCDDWRFMLIALSSMGSISAVHNKNPSRHLAFCSFWFY